MRGTEAGDSINASASTVSQEISGGGGNDTITGGSGSDWLYGGEGADTISAGAGNDSVKGDDGNDSLSGGTGNDTLDGGTGNDSLRGDAGDDSLTGGQGSDTLIGGAGNDQIFGGTETDLVQFANGWGSDTAQGGESAGDFDHLDLFPFTSNLTVNFTGSEAGTVTSGANSVAFSEFERFTLGSGSDLLNGSAASAAMQVEAAGGNDTLIGGAGEDSLYGGAGNDSLTGGAGNDRLFGDAGNDTLAGGIGNDSLFGGDGDDLLTGGSGDDVMTGGAGRDSFLLVEAGGGDRILDFQMTLIGSETTDRLDVSDLQNPDASPIKAWDVVISTGPSGETVLTFPEGETLRLDGVDPAIVAAPGMLHAMGVPCLVAGSRVQTPRGPRPIEALEAGDMVSLADGGAAPILWAGARPVDADELAQRAALRPVRIRAGSHGALRDTLFSPQHALRVTRGTEVALIRAGHLARLGWGARIAQGARDLTYHHLLLPRHSIILVDGVAAESLYPGRMSLAAFPPEIRAELADVLRRHCPPGPGQTLAEAYGPRCLPLLGFAAAKAFHRRASAPGFLPELAPYPGAESESGNHAASARRAAAL